MSPKGASDLINSKVGAEVIDEAKLINYQHNKDPDFKQDHNGKTYSDAEKVHQYQIFSAQIDLLGALINAEENERKQILLDGLVQELCKITKL